MNNVVDLEYAHKLATTLRWRTWPEEKPRDDTEIILMNQQGHVSPSYFYKNGRCSNMLGIGFPMGNNDRWMYVSDLEVVR